MSEEWGPWTEHCGTCVPVKAGAFVHLVFGDGDEFVGLEDSFGQTKFGSSIIPDNGEPTGWIWSLGGDHDELIIRYRIRKPRGLTILEGLLEEPFKVVS